LLTLGYFVCGFQVVFIGVHCPYLKDRGFTDPRSPRGAGADRPVQRVRHLYGRAMGQRMPKRYLLSFIYIARSVVIAGSC
jgi:hypothetical protein